MILLGLLQTQSPVSVPRALRLRTTLSRNSHLKWAKNNFAILSGCLTATLRNEAPNGLPNRDRAQASTLLVQGHQRCSRDKGSKLAWCQTRDHGFVSAVSADSAASPMALLGQASMSLKNCGRAPEAPAAEPVGNPSTFRRTTSDSKRTASGKGPSGIGLAASGCFSFIFVRDWGCSEESRAATALP